MFFVSKDAIAIAIVIRIVIVAIVIKIVIVVVIVVKMISLTMIISANALGRNPKNNLQTHSCDHVSCLALDIETLLLIQCVTRPPESPNSIFATARRKHETVGFLLFGASENYAPQHDGILCLHK